MQESEKVAIILGVGVIIFGLAPCVGIPILCYFLDWVYDPVFICLGVAAITTGILCVADGIYSYITDKSLLGAEEYEESNLII